MKDELRELTNAEIQVLHERDSWIALSGIVDDHLKEIDNHRGLLLDRLKAAEKDRAFYKCCALSGEIPAEGSEPSALLDQTP